MGTGRVRGRRQQSRRVAIGGVLQWGLSGQAYEPVGLRRRPRGVRASRSPAVGNKSARVGSNVRLASFGTYNPSVNMAMEREES